jgi:aryl-alcohol dehydrogenase-like predicted oxidoreductase
MGAEGNRAMPGTASLAHRRKNLAAEDVTLNEEALRDLDGAGAD